MSDEVPDADAEEQRAPARPTAQPGPTRPRPWDVPEADYLEQQRPLLSEEEDQVRAAGTEAPEADLLEQGSALPSDEEEEYPPPSGAAPEE